MDVLKRLRTLFAAQIGGLVLFAVFALYVALAPDYQTPSLNFNLLYLKMAFMVMLLVAVPLIFSLPKKRLSKLPETASVKEKLDLFQKNFIIKMATIEGLAIGAIIFFLLTKENTYLYVIGALLVFGLLNYPTIHKVCDELDIEESELTKN